MSRDRRTVSYSDTAAPKRGIPGGLQRGPTTDTVLAFVRSATDEEKRAAGLFAASTAIRQGWTGELADVVDALGLKP